MQWLDQMLLLAQHLNDSQTFGHIMGVVWFDTITSLLSNTYRMSALLSWGDFFYGLPDWFFKMHAICVSSTSLMFPMVCLGMARMIEIALVEVTTLTEFIIIIIYLFIDIFFIAQLNFVNALLWCIILNQGMRLPWLDGYLDLCKLDTLVGNSCNWNVSRGF